MVFIKELNDDKHSYIALPDHERDEPKSGTNMIIRCSLLSPEGVQTLVCKNNFLSDMSVKLPLNAHNASTFYKLHSILKDKSATNDCLPLLGRSILFGSMKWGSQVVRIMGDSSFIHVCWEWTEDVLFHFREALDYCGIYNAVYASHYSYDRDSSILRAFCESWCPSTNTLNTIAGQLSISLLDLHRLGGLPIAG